MKVKRLGLNHRGEVCDIKPITCQEGFCEDCQIYLDYQEQQSTAGKTIHGSITSRWLEEQEKELADIVVHLQIQVEQKRATSFSEARYGSREKKMQMQAMVNAYDTVLTLIKKAIGGK